METDENQRMSRLCDDREHMNRYNGQCSEKIAKIKKVDFKRETQALKHTPSPMYCSSLAPCSSYVEQSHSQTERHGKTSGKNRVEMRKREGTVVVAVPCQGLDRCE